MHWLSRSTAWSQAAPEARRWSSPPFCIGLPPWGSSSTPGAGSRSADLPPLSRWAVRASLVYLAVGFTLGALILSAKGVPALAPAWRWLPSHIEFLLFGWTAQLAMDVGYWILPRFSQEPRRGREGLAWLSIGLLNVGVLLAGLGPALAAPLALTLLGRSLELGAAAVFAVHVWPRVRPARAWAPAWRA